MYQTLWYDDDAGQGAFGHITFTNPTYRSKVATARTQRDWERLRFQLLLLLRAKN
jgi:hypothetical protein